MRWTHGTRARLRLLFRRTAEERMDEEMRFHLEMETEKNLRAGMGPDEARRRALLDFGGVERHREAMRDGRTLSWLGGASLDLKLGLRMLAKHPGLTLVGVLGLAVSIAIGAGVFSVLHTMYDPALPLDEGGRVVAVHNVDVADGGGSRTHLHDLESWRAELRALEDAGAYRIVDRNLFGPDGRAEPLRVAEMTASGFRVARVPPLLGRYLVEEDEREGASPAVVIGYDVWRTRFAGDPGVVGRTLQLGTERHTVVGVMPEGFAFPVNNRVWTPLRLDPADFERGEAPPVEVFGRLAPGATLERAQAQLETVGRRLAAAHPAVYEHVRPRVLPYTRAFSSAEPPAEYYVFQFIAGMLLVVIAVNVAILVYARTATRTAEIAVRLALGAGRGRIVAQLFAEALVLCLAAAAAGLAAAGLALAQVDGFVSRVMGEAIPFWWDFGLSPTAVAYVAGLAVLAALIVGVVPALKATGGQIQSSLRLAGGGGGMRMGRTWTVLIVAQVAVAVAILPATVALGSNELARSGLGGPGYAAGEVLSARLGMDRETPASAEADAYDEEFAHRLAARQAELARRLEAEPAVTAVTFASHVPGDWSWDSGVQARIEVEAPPSAAGGAMHGVEFLQVDPALFEVYGVPVLAGRLLHPADLTGPATAVVVNRSLVQRVFGGGEALGRRFRYAGVEGGEQPGGVERGGWYEVVGVVDDFPAKKGVTGLAAPTLYHPVAPGKLNPVSLLVRVRGAAPETIAPRLREITTALDPALRLSRVESVERLHWQRMRGDRVLTFAIAFAALSVLLLSAAGIHALMSFTVAQRRREIGIRTALGARPRRILWSIFARALRQLSLGVGVGAVLGAGLAYGELTAGRSAAVLLGVAVIVLGVGLLATLGPARRGLRIEPMEALRAEA
ncbi:MAG TPA: ABC transporter permease [Longimicrobiaceae bacterium]|nr:ABC transporter permease [Longimicrobiaceae bacterium]